MVASLLCTVGLAVFGCTAAADLRVGVPTSLHKDRSEFAQDSGGRRCPTSLTAFILGGTKDGVVTTISREVQTSWAPDRQFVGTLHLQDGRYVLTGSLSVDGADIFILPIACWNVPTQPTTSTRTHRALVFDGRSALAESE